MFKITVMVKGKIVSKEEAAQVTPGGMDIVQERIEYATCEAIETMKQGLKGDWVGGFPDDMEIEVAGTPEPEDIALYNDLVELGFLF